SSQAATNTYSGVSGNWSDTTKWTLGHAPLAGEDAVLSNGPAGTFSNVTVTLNVSTPFLNSLIVEGTNAGTVTFSQAANTLSNVSSENIGFNNGGRGALVLSGGLHSVGGQLNLGYNAGSTGSGTLSGTATLSVTNGEYIGVDGTGSFN